MSMPIGFDQRIAWAALLTIAAGAAAGLVAGNLQAALIAGVGGLAAVLIAGLETPEPAPPPADPAMAEADPELLGRVVDSIVQPVLLVRAGRVEIANRAARSELGAHVVGEDVRVAIRHPAAAARLSGPGGPTPERPVELVGLGSIDRRWEMRVGDVAGGWRVIQLIDRTGAYAAEQMRIDFVANASHELRTPLASILGFIETLGDEAGEDPAVRDRFLKIMWNEARRMQRLVEDLISLSRIEAEKHRPPDTPVDLAELAALVRGELASADPARGRDLQLATEPDVPPVRGDRARLSQMLHNMAGNGLKYGKPGTPVTIGLRRDGDMVRLWVADQGEGIAPEHIPRLTERFYRVDAGRSRSLGGTGLGLSIVKHIVERHRGRLEITSRQGAGTTVTVLFPPEGAVTEM